MAMKMWRDDNTHDWRGWWPGVIQRKDRHRHRIVITIIVVVIIILIDIDIIIDVSTSSLSTPTSTTPHRPSLRRGSSRVSATPLMPCLPPLSSPACHPSHALPATPLMPCLPPLSSPACHPSHALPATSHALPRATCRTERSHLPHCWKIHAQERCDPSR